MGRTLGTAHQRKEVFKCFYDENENETEEPEECTNKGRKRGLEAEEEFFIVLGRLRREFAEKHLAHLFQYLSFNHSEQDISVLDLSKLHVS